MIPQAWQCTVRLHTLRNLFGILLNQTEIQLYLPFSSIDLEQKTDTVRLLFQINRYMVYTNWSRLDLIRFRKDFSSIISRNLHYHVEDPWNSFISYYRDKAVREDSKQGSYWESSYLSPWWWWRLPLTVAHVRKRRKWGWWRGSMEEFEGRRKGMCECVELGFRGLKILVALWAGIPVGVTQEAGVVPHCWRAAIGTPF